MIINAHHEVHEGHEDMSEERLPITDSILRPQFISMLFYHVSSFFVTFVLFVVKKSYRSGYV